MDARAFLLSLLLVAPVALASHPLPPLGLGQRNSDLSALAVAATTSEGPEIELAASSDPATCGTIAYRLELEIQPTAVAFTNLPTHTSAALAKPSCVSAQYAWTRVTGLAPATTYKWQARERTATVGPWVLFNGGGSAFITGPAPINALAFVSASQALLAGSCSGATVVQHRSMGVPVNVTSSRLISLWSSSGTMTFYSDASCTTSLTAATMAAGTNSVTFYWKSPALGAQTIVADTANATWADQSQTVNPGPPTKLAIIDTNTSTIVGTCSAAKTVQSQDVGGNASPAVGAPRVVMLSSSSGSSTFYADPACTTAASSTPISLGASSATFYWKDTAQGARTLTATSAGLTDATQSNRVELGLQSISAAQTRTAGDCSALTTLQSQGANGVPFPVAAATVITLLGSGNVRFFSDATCTLQITTQTMSAGSSTIAFFWKMTTVGNQFLYGSAPFFIGYSQFHTILAAPATGLAFGSTAQTVAAGTCASLATARSRDAYGNFANVASTTAVALTTSSAGGSFHSDALCTAPITSVSLLAGTSSAGFYWKDTTPGTASLTLSTGAGADGGPVLAPGSQDQIVQARLAFVTAPQMLSVNQCSGVTTVRTQNGNSVAWNVPANTVVSLSSSSPAAPLFSDPGCTTAVTSVTLAAGTSSNNFYWLDTRVGNPVLSATAIGIAPTQQTQTIFNGAPAALEFTSAAQVVGAGLCSGLTTVEQRDGFGNKSTQAGARTIVLSSSSAGASFFTDSSCAIAAPSNSVVLNGGTSAVGFYWKDTAVGAPLLTASSTPLTAGTQAQFVSAGTATRLAFPGASQSLLAGQCSSAITVQTQNAAGTPSNVTAATTVALASSSAGGNFFLDPACATVPIFDVAIASGGNTATLYWRDTVVGSPFLRATAIGFQTATQSQTVTAGPAAKIEFTTADQTITAGSCSDLTSFTTGDAYENPVPLSAAVSAVLTSSSQGTSFFSDAACTQAITAVTVAIGTSSAGFYWRDAFTGTPTITATTATLGSDAQTHTVGGRDQVRFRWYSATGAPLAAENAAPQLLPGTTVHLRLAARSLGFNWKLQTGDVAPARDNLANEEVVTGSYLSLASADGAFQTLTESKTGQGQGWRALGNAANAGNPEHSYFLGSAVPPGQAAYPLCLLARTTGEALRIGWSATSAPTAAPRFPPGWQITTTALTETCFDLKADGFVGGPLTIYLQDALRSMGADSTTDTFTIDRLYVRGFPGTYVGLERSSTLDFLAQIQVTPGDFWDDPSNANGDRLASSLLTGTTSAETYVESRPSVALNEVDLASGKQGEWDFALRFPSSGGSHFYRFVLTDRLGTRLSLLEGMAAIPTAETVTSKLAFLPPAIVAVAGGCTGPVTVQVQDAAGIGRAGGAAVLVGLASTSAAGKFFSAAGCAAAATGLTVAAGANSVDFYWSDTVAGTPTLTATAVGLAAATRIERVIAGPATRLTVSGVPSPIEVAVAAAAQIEVQDAFGNLATAYVGTVELSSSDPLATLAAPATFLLSDSGKKTVAGAVKFGSLDLQTLTARDELFPQVTGTQSDILVIDSSTRDAGTVDPTPREKSIKGWSCGCQSSGAGFAWLALTGLLLLRLCRRPTARSFG